MTTRCRPLTLLCLAALLLSGCVFHIEGGEPPRDALPFYAAHERSPLTEHRVLEGEQYVPGGATRVTEPPVGAEKPRR